MSTKQLQEKFGAAGLKGGRAEEWLLDKLNIVYDEVIDLGFLQFEGTKLIKTYSSLVKSERKLSQFIQKLTSITEDDVKEIVKQCL